MQRRVVRTSALLRTAWTAGGLLVASAAAWAQTTETGGRSRDLVGGVLSTLLFGLIGIALAIIGFKLFDLVIRHNIEQEIFEKNNMAAALLAGSVVLGVSIIIAATLLS